MSQRKIAKVQEKNKSSNFFVRYGLLILVVFLFILFSLLQPSFITVPNIFGILRQASILGLLALGLTLIVIVGEFDISFVAISVFSGVIPVILIMHGVENIPLIWTIGITLGVGLSLINAISIVYIGIPSFIATLAMMMALTGAARGFTGGYEIFPSAFPPGFGLLGQYLIFGLLPVQIFIFIAAATVLTLFLDYSPLGRYIYAVGGNPDASTHVGINIKKVKFFVFFVAGLLYGIAGVVMSSMFGSANSSMGDGYLLPGIIVCFLGAIFLTEGVHNPRGTIVSVILMSILSNGFTMVNMPFYGKAITQGAILLIALIIVITIRKKQ